MKTLQIGLIVLLSCWTLRPACAELRYWNLDGEERVIPKDLSVRELLKTVEALKRGLQRGIRNRKNPGVEWSEGSALFRDFFGETKLAIDASLAGGRLSGVDSGTTLFSVQRDLSSVEDSIGLLRAELVFLERYTDILPSESHDGRLTNREEIEILQKRIERAEEKLEALYDLANTLAEFPADLKRYNERLLETLARNLGTDAEWQVSAQAEKAIEKCFQNDPAVAAAFQKAMVIGESTTLFASSEIALKLFLLAGDAAGKHLGPIERIRASPGAGWSAASRPLLAKLEREYGVKNTGGVLLSDPQKPDCGSLFDRLFRSKQSPELN